jgi:hypothetical protein
VLDSFAGTGAPALLDGALMEARTMLAADVQHASVLLSAFAHRDLAGPSGAGISIGADAESGAPRGERLWAYLCPHDTLPALLELVFQIDGSTVPVVPLGVKDLGIDEHCPQVRPVLAPEPGDADKLNPKGRRHE